VGLPDQNDNTEERLVLWVRATPIAEHDEATLSFCRRARTRVEVAGGELLASSGGSIGASVDAMELPDIIELAQGISIDAQSEAPGLDVACAIAHGSLASSPGQPVYGAAIDRAQMLAHRAEAGETVLDDSAAQQAEPMYLFRRELDTPNAIGRVLDPLFDKRSSREASELLRPAPWPSARESSYARLCAQLRVNAARFVLVAAQPHISLDRVTRARAELMPPLVLHLAREASGLAPLGAIAVALRRAWPQISSLPLDEETRYMLDRLHAGAGVRRAQAAQTLAAVLAAAAERHRGAGRNVLPWIVLERARELDGPSLLVIADVLEETSTPCSLLATLDDGASIPSALARVSALERIALDPLDDSARVQAAAAVLSLNVGDPLAERVAELGGDSVLAIETAARALVSAGDVVHDGKRFRFRTEDRRPPGSAPIEELVLSRISGLSNVAQRVLEAACVSPLAAPAAFTDAVAELDGLPEDAVSAGRDQLASEGLIGDDASLGPLETTVRLAVRGAMPPARSAELHRFVAQLMREHCPPEPSFQHAVVAHHLAEGGNDAGAASALLDAAYAASSKGFDRVAVRLAALALKLDGSGEARDRASRVAAAVESSPLTDTQRGAEAEAAAAEAAAEAASSSSDTLAVPRRRVRRQSTPPRVLTDPVALTPPNLASDAVRNALRAIMARDSDSAEAAIDTAVASGLGRAAAMRLWAMSQLAKGDVSEAVRALRRARTANGSGKQALTAALILLEAGYVTDAVRSALDALATTRRAGESRGEQAALLVLGGCYRRLGRSNEALLLEAHAG
jgi:hypothetical protein